MCWLRGQALRPSAAQPVPSFKRLKYLHPQFCRLLKLGTGLQGLSPCSHYAPVIRFNGKQQVGQKSVGF